MQVVNTSKTGVVSFRINGTLFNIAPLKYAIVPDKYLSELEDMVERYPQLEIVYDRATSRAMELATEARYEQMSPGELLIFKRVLGKIDDLKTEVVDRLVHKCLNWISHSGVHATAGGGATEVISAPGVTPNHAAIVTMNTVGATPVTIVSAKCVTDQIEVTLSGDPSNDHKLNYTAIINSI